VGDITGHGQFTHLAVDQAKIAVRDILDRPGPGADYRALSRVTFTDPEVGAVGMTQAQARVAGLPVAGPTGGKAIGMLALAVHTEVPAAAMRNMIYAYPTFHRGIEDARRELRGP
jgi:pyruvate/2-oxoglutarate dehydrogenase complex dihydrolipoamide dehydrogenase (E3) component